MGKFSEMSDEEQDDYMDAMLTGLGDKLERMTVALEKMADDDESAAPSTEDLRFAIYEIESKNMAGVAIHRRLAGVEKVFQYIQNGTVPDAPSGSE